MARPIIILGAGGHARDVLDVLEACHADDGRYEPAGFVVDENAGAPGTFVNGLPILGDFTWLAAQSRKFEVVAAVGDTDLRLALLGRALAAGARLAEAVVHPSVVRTRRLELGAGAVVGAGVTLTSLVRLGRNAHVNNGCHLAHDVAVGDHATISPGVCLSGNVTVGQGAYVGTGATVIQKRTIGAWSVVGAGATVIHDVPDNVTVVGVPARVIAERPPGWHLARQPPPA